MSIPRFPGKGIQAKSAETKKIAPIKTAASMATPTVKTVTIAAYDASLPKEGANLVAWYKLRAENDRKSAARLTSLGGQWETKASAYQQRAAKYDQLYERGQQALAIANQYEGGYGAAFHELTSKAEPRTTRTSVQAIPGGLTSKEYSSLNQAAKQALRAQSAKYGTTIPIENKGYVIGGKLYGTPTTTKGVQYLEAKQAAVTARLQEQAAKATQAQKISQGAENFFRMKEKGQNRPYYDFYQNAYMEPIEYSEFTRAPEKRPDTLTAVSTERLGGLINDFSGNTPIEEVNRRYAYAYRLANLQSDYHDPSRNILPSMDKKMVTQLAKEYGTGLGRTALYGFALPIIRGTAKVAQFLDPLSTQRNERLRDDIWNLAQTKPSLARRVDEKFYHPIAKPLMLTDKRKFYKDPDVQAAGIVGASILIPEFAGGLFGSTAGKITGGTIYSGFLGKQTYETVKKTTRENIYAETLMVGVPFITRRGRYSGESVKTSGGGLPSENLLVQPIEGVVVKSLGIIRGGAEPRLTITKPLRGEPVWITSEEFAAAPKDFLIEGTFTKQTSLRPTSQRPTSEIIELPKKTIGAAPRTEISPSLPFFASETRTATGILTKNELSLLTKTPLVEFRITPAKASPLLTGTSRTEGFLRFSPIELATTRELAPRGYKTTTTKQAPRPTIETPQGIYGQQLDYEQAWFSAETPTQIFTIKKTFADGELRTSVLNKPLQILKRTTKQPTKNTRSGITTINTGTGTILLQKQEASPAPVTITILEEPTTIPATKTSTLLKPPSTKKKSLTEAAATEGWFKSLSSTKTRVGSLLASILATGTKTKSASTQQTWPGTATIPASEQKAGQQSRQAQQLDQAQGISTLTTPATQTDTKQETRTDTLQDPLNELLQRRRPRTDNNRPVITDQLRKKSSRRATIDFVEEWLAQIKKKGRYITIGKGTKAEAKNTTLRALLGTLAATGRLMKSGRLTKKTGSESIISLDEYFRTYQIRQGKRIPLRNTFIQKRSARLTTQQERAAITSARKNAFFGGKSGGGTWL